MKSISSCILWFRSRGIYDTFKRYAENNGKTFEDLYRRNPSGMVDAAFTWSQTPEGRSFWSNINEEFADWYYDENTKVLQPKSSFNLKENVTINSQLSSCIVEIDEEMLSLCGKKATIIDIDYFGYCPESTDQDGCFYYINKDNSIHSWTNNMFKK